jgi:hypothetical protein
MKLILTSTEAVNTPGIVRWAINGYKFKSDRKRLLNVLMAYAPDDEREKYKKIFHRLLLGKIEWAEQDGSVTFTIPEK